VEEAKRQYYIKNGYAPRDRAEYYIDAPAAGLVYQPYVYSFAAYLGRLLGCSSIIDVGCGTADKLAQLHTEFDVIGIDFGPNVASCRAKYSFGTWIEWDLDRSEPLPIPMETSARSVVVCADVLEHLMTPEHLLANLGRLLESAPVCILTTPERDRARGQDDMGPPANPHHVREWNRRELEQLVCTYGLCAEFSGVTANNNTDLEKKTSLCVLRGASGRTRMDLLQMGPKPVKNRQRDFRVVALMCVHNEADILVQSIGKLTSAGIDVYVIDNWSTDSSYELAVGLQGRGVIGVERFPPGGDTGRFEWQPLLGRVEELTSTLDADWFIHQDADEVRVPPWPDANLREAICRVDREGYNVIDHTVIVFPPTDNDYVPGEDFERHFRYFEFGARPGHFAQVKTWKNTGVRVSLAPSGGHDVSFPGRRVYPYKFLLKHYPIRSQGHGQRKVFCERMGRWSDGERAKGLHTQYDHIGRDHCFLRRPSELSPFSQDVFNVEYLVERLSGVGISASGSGRSALCQDSRTVECCRCNSPNLHARPASLVEVGEVLEFHGYQEFRLGGGMEIAACDEVLKRKRDLLEPYFTPRYLMHRSVVDLGANGGFFSLWALQRGADKVTAVEMDEAYLDMLWKARERLQIGALEVVVGNVADWDKPVDVTLALGLVHWVYSCTATFGSLDAVGAWLARCTQYMLIVEWIEPADPAIEFFHHTDWNMRCVTGPYSREAFEAALSKHFARWQVVGAVSPTRDIYVAFRSCSEIDLSGPLPLLRSKEDVVSCQCLARNEQSTYWSCVYDNGDTVLKQTTGDLATHEYSIMESLPSTYFPEAISSRSDGDSSFLILEKVRGVPLLEARDSFSDPRKARAFALDCLRILAVLKEQRILHRDIRPDNMLVRDGHPVLLDFGWGIHEGEEYLTPDGLGGTERPPMREFCDVYSMGKTLERAMGHRFPALDRVFEVMAEPHATLRVCDLSLLRAALAMAGAGEGESELGATLQDKEQTAAKLQEQARALRDKEQTAAKLQEQERALRDKEQTVANLQEQARVLRESTSWKLVEFAQRVRLKFAPPGTFRERVLRLVVRAGIAWKRKGLAYVARRGLVKGLAHMPWRGSRRRALLEARAGKPQASRTRPTLLGAVRAIAAGARRKGGLAHLTGRALRLIREKGFREAFRRAYAYCTAAHSAAPGVATPYEPYLPSEEEAYIAPHAVTDLPADLRVAVVVHAFYPDVFPEFCQYLRNMPCRYTLLVSVQDEDARREIEAEAAGLPFVERIEIRVVPNRGRDIAPLLVEFGPLLRDFDYVCHVHTKRSLHTASGDAWRRYLCDILLGSKERIQALLATFVNDEDVGLVYPEPYKDVPYIAYGWLKNGAIAGKLWARLGIPFDPTGYVDMPAGSMFWARRSALDPLLDLHLTWADFPEESAQTEGTLQHTIERCFIPVARKFGYKCLVIKEAEPLLFSLHDHRNLRQYLATPFEAKLRNVLPAAEVVSFDIFDTLLIRPFHRPDMVLRYLEHRVARELGIHGYFDLRKQAEETARARKGPADDVTLAEIYATLADKFAIDHGTALKMLNMEVSVELSLLRRRETIPEIGEEIRATGKRVILVSDFYWERPRIEAMLAEKGIAFYDELYLSSAVGKRKDRGDLWEHVVQQEGVPKTSLLHVGDNEHSDILELWDRGFMPPVHVMRPAVLFRQSRLGEVLHHALRPDEGWENSLLYGLCANRLCSQPDGRGAFSSSPPLSDPHALGYVAFGPVVFTFVSWLARASARDGVQQLKFLSREGFLLHRAFGLVAEHLARFCPTEPLAQGAYFLCSRRAVQFACLETEVDIHPMLTKHFRGTLRQLFDARFQIANMRAVEKRLGSRKLDTEIELPGSHEEVLAGIVKVFDVLREQAEEEREALRKYCAEQELDGKRAVGLVDIGYSGSIQAAMARLLGQQLRGYYFATLESARHSLGDACQACFASFVDPRAGDPPSVLRYNLLLEAVLTASVGQLIRFEESSEGVRPVFKRPGVAQRRFPTILRIQEGILDFVRDVLSLFGPDGANIEFPRELVQQCFSLVARGELSVGDLQTALRVEDDYCGRGEVDVLAWYRKQ